MSTTDRRDFLRRAAAGGLGALAAATPGLGLAGDPAVRRARSGSSAAGADGDPFEISLAQWSLHRAFQAGELDPLNFGPIARHSFGIEAIEYVNQFFMDRARDQAYLREMRRRAEWAGVDSWMIMIDGEGNFGAPDASERQQAVENHKKWVEAARFLGCENLRVNAFGEGGYEETVRRNAEALRELTEFAAEYGVAVCVENHGGHSSNGEWVVDLVERVDHENFGTLPDFGNFEEDQNPYENVELMMPYAKGVSAKSYSFSEEGWEESLDYRRLMEIVLGAGYHDYVGIEYEGDQYDEFRGIRATKELLERIRYERTS